jgi:hypothetical protein
MRRMLLVQFEPDEILMLATSIALITALIYVI